MLVVELYGLKVLYVIFEVRDSGFIVLCLGWEWFLFNLILFRKGGCNYGCDCEFGVMVL